MLQVDSATLDRSHMVVVHGSSNRFDGFIGFSNKNSANTSILGSYLKKFRR
jgi:hypothetical protein